MKILRNFSRLFLGLIFIFSGFVKIVDPLGTKYKFIDYFNAMNLEFLTDIALPIAILLCVAELVLGLMIFFNLLPKLSSLGILLFMIMFTPLTLWLAIENPVHDCGCFGDALILSNWATFGKNVVILAFSIFVFLQRNKFKPDFNLFTQSALSLIFTIFVFALSLFCINHLPIIDFRPYQIGKNIQEGMSIPEEEKDNIDVYESVFIYEKNGEEKEFTLDNLPDSTWKFIDAEHNLIKEGYEPPIHDFSISSIQKSTEETTVIPTSLDPYDAIYLYAYNGETMEFMVDELPEPDWDFVEVYSDQENFNAENVIIYYEDENGNTDSYTVYDLPDFSQTFSYAEYYNPQQENNLETSFDDMEDITEAVLNNENYTFLLVSTFVEDANTKRQEDINNIAAFCEQEGYRFICLTASTEISINEFVESNDATYQFYNTDPITLKTIVRSNPGLVLIKKGTILNKWAYRDIPKVEELTKNLSAYSINSLQVKSNKRLVWLYILGSILFFILIRMLYQWLKTKKYIL